MLKTKNVKLDINDAVTVEIALCEWFYTTMRKKVTSELEADARRYHAEAVIDIVNRLGDTFHHNKVSKHKSNAMNEELKKWVEKNAKWFESDK